MERFSSCPGQWDQRPRLRLRLFLNLHNSNHSNDIRMTSVSAFVHPCVQVERISSCLGQWDQWPQSVFRCRQNLYKCLAVQPLVQPGTRKLEAALLRGLTAELDACDALDAGEGGGGGGGGSKSGTRGAAAAAGGRPASVGMRAATTAAAAAAKPSSPPRPHPGGVQAHIANLAALAHCYSLVLQRREAHALYVLPGDAAVAVLQRVAARCGVWQHRKDLDMPAVVGVQHLTYGDLGPVADRPADHLHAAADSSIGARFNIVPNAVCTSGSPLC